MPAASSLRGADDPASPAAALLRDSADRPAAANDDKAKAAYAAMAGITSFNLAPV